MLRPKEPIGRRLGAWLHCFSTLLLADGCAGATADATPVRQEFKDEGAVCLRSQSDGSVEVLVTFPICLSSSCSRALETSCEIELEDGKLVLRSDGAAESTGATECTADCGFLTAKCSSEALEPGDYELVHGEDSADVTLPADAIGLFDDGSPGALCEP